VNLNPQRDTQLSQMWPCTQDSLDKLREKLHQTYRVEVTEVCPQETALKEQTPRQVFQVER
jgi:hypothetical protein